MKHQHSVDYPHIMADLIVKREVAWHDLLRRYAIEIDGECVAYVRAGGTTHVTIAEGMRKLRLSIDGYSSKEKTILASNQCLAVVNCAPADFPAPAKHFWTSPIGTARHLPLDRTSYLDIHLDRSADLARAFLHAAWSVARYQIQERTKPGDRSRYGLTAGDLSVLYHGCRIAGANMVTSLGSANDRLWGELVRIKWLTPGSVPAANSGKAVGYQFTELGQMELLDIFGG